MQEVCPKIDCTGCQSCVQICPKSAITIREDAKGHVYPKINQLDCIDCGLCIKHCPSVNELSLRPPIKVIAGWVRDVDRRKSSTSGGISYALSKLIVQSGGYFCGVVWDEQTYSPKHLLTNDINQLEIFQGSRYSHSDTNNAFKEIKMRLLEGKSVLYTGTPCQVAGLKSYLGKSYKNLFTVDLICHGVPSKRILRDRVISIERISGKKVVDLKSREKTPNQYFTSTRYFHDDGTSTYVSVYEDPFFRCFVKNYCLRPNCYRCKYSQKQRVSDLTIGDYWGYVPYSIKFRSYRKGTSVILINSSKGESLFDGIKKELVYEERDFENAASCNRNLIGPQEKPKGYDEFWKAYIAGEGLENLSEKYFPSIKFKIKKSVWLKAWIKMLLPLGIVKLLKKER